MSPEIVDAISSLGALGFAVLAVWGFATGRVRPGSLVDRREAELLSERDEWRTIAETAIAKIGPLTAAVEKLAGTKLE